ncbi:trichohyalin [Etheostoma spectabile]|uniref:trichohyalin n=1 Tax=Etheostoma spectabile TaxID=54343 RepID=UPI0013AECC64|nr:trichohyalin-like [Etheostoma spectabile]
MDTYQSTDHVETFLEEFREQIIAGVRSTTTIIEAWNSQQPTTISEALTPQEQMRVLFHVVEQGTPQFKFSFYQILSQEEPKLIADLEQRQQNSRMTQTEQKWTMENNKQDKQMKVNIKTKRETIKRQRQLTCQVKEAIEQLWERTQRDRNEIDYLKKNTEQKEEDIKRLTVEKQEQCLLIKRLRSQIENIIKKLEENKNEAAQEKMQFLKMRTEIYQERETLEKRRNELINERHKMKMTKSQENKEPKEPMEQIKRKQEITERLKADSLLSLINKNKKIVFEAKQAKDQMEKNMADIHQEIQRNKKDISQHREQIEHIKHILNVNIQRAVKMQKGTAPEMESIEMQKEDRDTFDTVKIKVSRIHEEMEKLWDVLEDSEQQMEMVVRGKQELKTKRSRVDNISSDSQSLIENTDVSMKTTEWEIEVNADMQREKQNLKKRLAEVQSEKDEIQKIKTEIQTEKKNIERDRQLVKAEMNALKCVRESTEMQIQELNDKLQRTKKDIREMEIMNTEIELKKKDLVKIIRMSRRKKEEISKMMEETGHSKSDVKQRQDKTEKQKSEQRLEVNMDDRFDKQKLRLPQAQHEETLFENDNMDSNTQNKVNTDIKRVMLEIEEIRKMNKTREEMLKAQTNMDQNMEEVKKYMVS